ncbi:MAG TPA: asparagine synthase-related protein, partial [Bryobacteraceae bacterium]|nr:asparagine synthase-related protein [Bryobacteraceae bacterium]
MGRLSGICNFNGRPASPEELSKLHGFAGPEDRLFAAGGISTIERGGSTAVSQGPSALICHWEGRLDNRAAFAGLPGCGPEASEAQLALAAPRREFPQHLSGLIGDFSLAIWDGEQRSLWLATDYAGVRPLYFHRSSPPDGTRVVWSTSLEALAKWTGQGDLDPDYLTEFLVRGAASGGRTPWKEISAVPPGCALCIRETGIQTEYLWRPPLDRETTLAGEAEYEEQFRVLFREAVRSRLNVRGMAVAELSGGLDSSSVVCMARDLIRAGDAAASGLTTLSYAEPGGTDEKFIQTVQDACALPAYHLPLRDDSFASIESVPFGAPARWEMRNRAIRDWMSGIGASALLTGQLGDLVMGSCFDGAEPVAEDLSHGRLGAALRESLRWGRAQRQPVYRIFSGAARLALRWQNDPAADFGRTALTPAALRRAVELTEARIPEAHCNAAPGRRIRLASLLDMLQVRHLQSPEALRPAAWSHAFTHRPLVEFMMTIPVRVAYRPGEPRRLMRRALSGLLPQEIVRRRSKAAYTDVFRRALLPMVRELLRSPAPLLLAERGLIDPQETRTRFEHFTLGLEC